MQHDTAPPEWFKPLIGVCVGIGALVGVLAGGTVAWLVWTFAGAGVAILIASAHAIATGKVERPTVEVRTAERRGRDRDRLRRAQDVQRDAERRQTLDKAGDLD